MHVLREISLVDIINCFPQGTGINKTIYNRKYVKLMLYYKGYKGLLVLGTHDLHYMFLRDDVSRMK